MKKKNKHIWCSTRLVYPKGPSPTRPYPTVSSCYSHVIIVTGLRPLRARNGRTGREEENSTTAKMLIWLVGVCVQGYICKFFFCFSLFWKRSRNGFARFYFAPGEHYLADKRVQGDQKFTKPENGRGADVRAIIYHTYVLIKIL